MRTEEENDQRELLDCRSIMDYNHKWPRGLRKKLTDLDGGTVRCWWCWRQCPGLHIAHISRKHLFINDKEQYFANHAYAHDNKYNPRFLVLLCPSCHAKHDKALSRESPWMRGFERAFEERFQKWVLNEEAEK